VAASVEVLLRGKAQDLVSGCAAFEEVLDCKETDFASLAYDVGDLGATIALCPPAGYVTFASETGAADLSENFPRKWVRENVSGGDSVVG
jgi:hypothetical protein